MVNTIDLEKVSLLLSQKLNKKIKITGIEAVVGGYHSHAFKLISENSYNFFLKKIKLYDLGFEIPERQLMSYLISSGMYHRSGFNPETIGVMVGNKEETIIIPDINEDTAIYHIQEFQPDGVSYLSLIQGRKQKAKVDESDINELENITDFIKSLHQVKHPTKDVDQLKAVYNDGLRSVLTCPELTIMMLHDFTDTHPIFPPKEHGAYIGLMLEQIHQWKDRYKRLVAIHGDFTGANLFFRNDGSVWVIDYSRIPWGDPGIDIGWWLSQYLWLYHETQNKYFKELGEKFLELYVKKTGDGEIRQTVCLVLGLMGITFISPRFYPNLNPETGKRFFANILKILRGDQLVWRL